MWRENILFMNAMQQDCRLNWQFLFTAIRTNESPCIYSPCFMYFDGRIVGN